MSSRRRAEQIHTDVDPRKVSLPMRLVSCFLLYSLIDSHMTSAASLNGSAAVALILLFNSPPR